MKQPRGRPPRTPHPIEEHLQDLLRPATVVAYGQVAKQIDASGLTSDAWLRKTIADHRETAKLDPNAELKKSTLAVYRSAAAYYAEFVEGSGTRDQAILRMPKPRIAPDGELRTELTPDQLHRFREIATQAPEPCRTVLLLLPLTGCRISEVCGLERSGIDPVRRTATVLGKRGKRREVPLNRTALGLLTRYQREHTVLGPRVFYRTETPSGAPLDEPRPFFPRDVWRYFGPAIREDELLQGVALHQTRHTAATGMMQRGKNLKAIQDTLGHRSIRSLERYLHTALEGLADAVEALEE